MAGPVFGVTPCYLTSASFPSFALAAPQKEEKQWSAPYGPFAYRSNLRDSIIQHFKDKIDATPYTLTYEDINLGLTVEGEKAAAKLNIANPNNMFEPQDFGLLSERLAKRLNDWVGRNVFTAADFMPRDEDFPKGRNVDPQNRMNVANKNKWMTIDEYIDKIFLRATGKHLDLLRVKMQKYLAEHRN